MFFQVPWECLKNHIILRVQDVLNTEFLVAEWGENRLHKVQGLLLQNVVISFKSHKQNSFNCEQVYAALSRATSLQGLHILNELDSKHLKVDSRARDEYIRLRRFKPKDVNEIVPTNDHENSVITLCLLNRRSLRKLSSDIKCDVNLFKKRHSCSYWNTTFILRQWLWYKRQLYSFYIIQLVWSQFRQIFKFRNLHTTKYSYFAPGTLSYFKLTAVRLMVSCDSNILEENVAFLLAYLLFLIF